MAEERWYVKGKASTSYGGAKNEFRSPRETALISTGVQFQYAPEQ
jgi:hypothetical protein